LMARESSITDSVLGVGLYDQRFSDIIVHSKIEA